MVNKQINIVTPEYLRINIRKRCLINKPTSLIGTKSVVHRGEVRSKTNKIKKGYDKTIHGQKETCKK